VEFMATQVLLGVDHTYRHDHTSTCSSGCVVVCSWKCQTALRGVGEDLFPIPEDDFCTGTPQVKRALDKTIGEGY
jgi:hypothetical protein